MIAQQEKKRHYNLFTRFKSQWIYRGQVVAQTAEEAKLKGYEKRMQGPFNTLYAKMVHSGEINEPFDNDEN